MEVHSSNLVREPAAARYTDPLAKVPTDGLPLRLLTEIREFPPDYLEKRPRLVDIYHPLGFGSIKDCSRLRCMDAIMTILWYYDPAVLTLYAGLENWKVAYYRSAGPEGRFEIRIHCSNSEIWVYLGEKIIYDNGVAVRPKVPAEVFPPYIRVRYQCDGNPLAFREYKTWTGPLIDGDPSLVPDDASPEVIADQDRCIARYLLLNKPWEAKPGVQQTCTIDQWSRNPDGQSFHEKHSMPYPSLKRKENIYESVRWADGGDVKEEVDYYGFPSRVDC